MKVSRARLQAEALEAANPYRAEGQSDAFKLGWRQNARGQQAEVHYLSQLEKKAFWKGWDAFLDWVEETDPS
jgi:hypothetical protein